MARFFHFGTHCLDTAGRTLTKAGERVHLTNKAYDLLLLLLQSEGALVAHEEIFERLWPEGFVDPSNVTQTLYMLRQALGSNCSEPFIESVRHKGYRFLPPVRCEDVRSEAQRNGASRMKFLWPAFMLLLAAILTSSSGGAVKRVPGAALREYALGRFYAGQRTPGSLAESERRFHAAIAADPAYGDAFAGLIDTFSAQDRYREPAGPPRNQARALAALGRVHALKCTTATCLTSEAIYLLNYQWWTSRERGISFLKAALSADAGFAPAHEWYSWELFNDGKIEEAITHMSRARDLEPLSAVINTALSLQLYYAHRFPEAMRAARDAAALDPQFGAPYEEMGLAAEQMGDYMSATRYLRRSISITAAGEAVLSLAHLYARMHRTGDAYATLRRAADVPPYEAALVYNALGHPTEARKFLKAAQGHLLVIPAMVRFEPRFAELQPLMRAPKPLQARSVHGA